MPAFLGMAIGAGLSALKKKVTKGALKKIAKKAIAGASGGSLVTGLVGGLSLPKFGGFPGMSGGGDWGKVGKGVFGSSKGRIAAGEMGACPKGYHLNRNKLTDGTEPRTVCVRNRSINFANGRAARRAGRRLRGTVKMLKRSFSFVSATKKKGKFIARK